MSTYEIVLLGANMGGIPMAHYLLQHTIPKLNALDRSHTYHLTIVSPNSHYHFKIAAPKVLLDEKQIPASKVVHSIEGILKRYPSSAYQHVLGKATAVDPNSKRVSISTNTGAMQNIAYDSLIIATGVHYESPLFTAEYPTEVLNDAHSKIHRSLPNARTVVVAGGGPVGVETAGQLADHYPRSSITLYSGTSRLLERNVNENISAVAERQLKSLGVDVVHKIRVVDGSAEVGAPTTLKFDDGSEKAVDVYINAIGAHRNTTYLPESWLEKNGGVKADKDTLRATAPGAQDVYVLGDANINSNGQSMWAVDGVRPLASALAIDAVKKITSNEKAAAIDSAASRPGLLDWLLSLFGFGGKKVGTGIGYDQQHFKSMVGLVVPIGKTGTGLLPGGFKAPGFLVHMAKGKSYMTWLQDDFLSGKALAKE